LYTEAVPEPWGQCGKQIRLRILGFHPVDGCVVDCTLGVVIRTACIDFSYRFRRVPSLNHLCLLLHSCRGWVLWNQLFRIYWILFSNLIDIQFLAMGVFYFLNYFLSLPCSKVVEGFRLD